MRFWKCLKTALTACILCSFAAGVILLTFYFMGIEATMIRQAAAGYFFGVGTLAFTAGFFGQFMESRP